MSVPTHRAGVAPTGGGSTPGPDTAPGVRPRGARACAAPRLARRMDHRPRPRLRRVGVGVGVGEDAAVGPAPVPAPGPVDAAWDAATEAARAQVGPMALRILAAVAEVLDGRRPPGHLTNVCPPEVLDEVHAQVAAARRGPHSPRGARVRGLRMCPVVTTGPHPTIAVEIAAALCVLPRAAGAEQARAAASGPGRRRARGPVRGRAVAARVELRGGRWQLTRLVLG